jgi:hypothetical protein
MTLENSKPLKSITEVEREPVKTKLGVKEVGVDV